MSTPANPFTTRDAEAEIAAWGNPPAATVGDVAVAWRVGPCRIDTPGYLNWAVARRPLRYPIIRVRGKIWIRAASRAGHDETMTGNDRRT